MDTRRRTIIITLSILLGTLLSAGLFMLRGGGKLDSQSVSSLVTSAVFAFAIIFFIGILFKKNNQDKF